MSKLKSLILLVEDEINQIELLRYNLETEGYKVAVAMDGEEGVLKALELKPDLVLLDWMLPKVSGIEVCRQIRRNKDIKETPVIMLTARSAEDDKIRGLDVVVVISAMNKEHSFALLEKMNFPFIKKGDN